MTKNMRVLLCAAVLAVAPATITAQTPGMLVSGDWLEGHLKDRNLVVVHVDNRRATYDEGHIPGARFIAIDDVMVDGDPPVGYELPPVDRIVAVLEAAGVSDDSHVVVYGITPLAATRLWTTLDYIGMGDRASVLDGGLIRWKADGRALSTDVPGIERGRITARPRPDMVVKAEWIEERLDDAGTLLIDARPDDEYTGADGGMGGMTHPGHIPGAYQLYWEELIADRQTDPVFLPESRLREKFASAGADEAKTIVAYCMVGWRASLVYFTGRMLGYEMRFYDGSWHDWGARDLPFVSGSKRR